MKVKRFGLVEVRGGWIPFWAPRLLAAPCVEKLRRCFERYAQGRYPCLAVL